MKARFTIERIFANTIELELDNATVAIESKDGFDNIMRLAEAQYSDLVDAGKEPEIGDQIEVKLIPVCDHCGEEIVGEDETPCFIDGHMVCESCYDVLNKYTRREEDLEDAGVELYKIADLIILKMRNSNNIPAIRTSATAAIIAIQQLLEAMNVSFKFSTSTNGSLYTSFTLNGKTYTI